MYYNCPSLFHQTDNIAHRDPTDDGGDPARTGEAWLFHQKGKGKFFFFFFYLLPPWTSEITVCVWGVAHLYILKKKGKRRK